MLNFETILRSQYWFRGHSFNNLEYLLYIQILIKILAFLVHLFIRSKYFRHAPYFRFYLPLKKDLALYINNSKTLIIKMLCTKFGQISPSCFREDRRTD